MCPLLGITDGSLDFIRILLCKIAEHILILFLACSKHSKLHILGCQQFIHNISYQIKSLLACHSRYNTDQHGILFHRKTKFFL